MSETNGTRLIDKIVAATPLDRRPLHIPEWDTTLYFKPLTKAAMDAALPQDDVKRPPSTMGLFLLVESAEDEQGNKVFAKRDIEKLRTKVDLSVLNRIEGFMFGMVLPTITDAEGAITADPTSGSV